MTAPCIAIRDAIIERINTDYSDYKKVLKTPVPQLQPDQLPILSVFVMNGTDTPDGDSNAGEPRFLSDDTIGISVVRGFDDPDVLDGTIADEIEAIKDTLFCDQTFVTFGATALFESIERVARRWSFPQNGETYFVECRLEITFRGRVSYPPRVIDDLEGIDVTYRPTAQTASPSADRRTTIERKFTLETE